MNFSDYQKYDAIGLARLIKNKEVSPDEVLAVALSRLDETNPRLNFLAQDLREFTKSWQGDTDAPLYGVPFLLKDLLADLAGTPTKNGSFLTKDYIATTNSILVNAYLKAGLRPFGKTTTPEWGLYPVTESRLYGTTHNPYHTDHTAGGSSGGSAVAVAVGVVPVAHAGDGGGSIRLPAHNCGLFGLKPTRGRTAFTPNFRESWQGLVTEHALTRTVRDSALLLDIATQTQNGALYACASVPDGGFLGEFDRFDLDKQKPKIAFWGKPYLGGENDQDTQTAFDNTLKLLERSGFDVYESTPDFTEPSVLNRAVRVLIMGEIASLYYHYKVQFGRELSHDLFDAPTWALITQGRQISAGELSWARGVMLAQETKAREFFERFDVLVTPVCPRTTPKNGTMLPPKSQDKLIRLLFGTLRLGKALTDNPLIEKEAIATLHYVGYTFPFNMSGNPAMSVPLQTDRQGLPMGMQFVAGHGQESLLFALAKRLNEIKEWENRVVDIT